MARRGASMHGAILHACTKGSACRLGIHLEKVLTHLPRVLVDFRALLSMTPNRILKHRCPSLPFPSLHPHQTWPNSVCTLYASYLQGNRQGRIRIDELSFAMCTHAGFVHIPVHALDPYLGIGLSDTLYTHSSRPLEAWRVRESLVWTALISRFFSVVATTIWRRHIALVVATTEKNVKLTLSTQATPEHARRLKA